MESSSSHQVAETMHDISPRTVRTNWLLFAWSQISGATKVLLLVSIALSLIQISTTIVVLVIGSNQGLSCERPLQLYLIIFVVRVGLSLPLSVYQHLFMPRRGRRIRNQQTTVSSPTTSEEETTTAIENNTTTTTEEQTVEQSNRPQPATIVSGWTERIKSLLDLFAILWFIVGNYLVFSKSSCSQVASLYYYTTLTWILFGYTILIIPLLACASVIFCLPCVLVAMRTFNINISNVMVGGTKEEIAKIPVFKYKDTSSTQQQSTESSTTMKKKKGWLGKKNQKENERLENTNQYLTIPKVEDAVCTICLSEYENDELICKLWCDHHYHQSCVSEWLGLNSKCPLCKRDFRGKRFSTDEQTGEEQV